MVNNFSIITALALSIDGLGFLLIVSKPVLSLMSELLQFLGKEFL